MKYLDIYEKLRDDIVSGVYESGTKLPSKRDAADRFNVSVISVQHAYELLEDEGYITSKERSGYYVTFDERESFGQKTPFSELIGQNDLVYQTFAKTTQEPLSEASEPVSGVATLYMAKFPFSVYAKTVRTVLSDCVEEVLSRSPGQGREELRIAICGYLARSRGLNVSPEQIVIGSGAEYLYGQIIDMLGRYISYGIEDPSYGKILQVYRLNGARTEALKLRKDGIESRDLWNSSVGVLHITPYRSYPSGVSASASKKREYIRFANERGAWIIEDDFESEFTPSSKPEETIFGIDGGRRVVYVNSFTMTVAPGVRMAYMVLPDVLVPVYKERLGFSSCTVPTLDQLVLARLINGGDFERHINRVRRRIRREKEERNE